MGLFDRLLGRDKAPDRRSYDSFDDNSFWAGAGFTSRAAAGVSVNQFTALNATAVLACVTMLSEDFAKLTPVIYKKRADGGRDPATDHELYALLYQPNSWQNWFEFAEMMQASLVMRGNAYAVRLRNGRGVTTSMVPVNADWVALWEAPGGAIFYHVTPQGLHMMAELDTQPFLIPAEDMFHVRGFSVNGLLGASRIMLAKEAIGLALAQEQQSSRWMGNGARPSGILTTDAKLSPEAAKRMADDWKTIHGGPQNSGKTAVFEQGLKWQAMSLSSQDLEFIASRKFQLEEIARIFRVPLHMVGELSRSTNNNVAQQFQEYVNISLSGYTSRWGWKLDADFGLRKQGLELDWDMSALTKADITTRYANYARGVAGGFLKPNEARLDDGRNPDPEGDELLQPANMAAMGSQSSGAGADGGGHPVAGQEKV